MDSEVVVFLRGRIEDFQAKMGTAAGEIDKLEKKGGGGFQKLASVGKAALLGLAVGAVAFGEQAVKNYDEVEAAHAKLETALKNSGTTWAAQKTAVEKLQGAGEKLGFSYADTQAALAVGVTGLGSASKAMGLLGIAQDLARFKNIDLASAMLVVTKGAEGQIKPIKALGIDLPIAASGAKQVQAAQDKVSVAQEHLTKATAELTDGHTKHAKAMADVQKASDNLKAAQDKLWTTASGGQTIIDTLSEKLKGQASASADTFQGKLKVLDAQWKDMSAKAGPAIIGILQNLAGALTDTVAWFEKHKVAAYAAAIVIGGILTAAITAFIALKIEQTIKGLTLAFNALGFGAKTAAAGVGEAAVAEEGAGVAATGMAGPLGLAAVAIGAVYLAATHMSNAVKVNIEDLKKMSTDALAKVIPDLDKAGITHKAFNTVLAASPEQAQKFIDALRQAGDKTGWYDDQLKKQIVTQKQADASNAAAADQVKALSGAVGNIPGQKTTVITADTLQAWAQIDALNAHLAQTLGTQQITLTGGGGVLQHRAAGGPVSAGQSYVVGEHRPEVFTPGQSGVITPYVPSGGTTLNVNVTAAAANPSDVGRAVVEAIRQYELRSGIGWRS